MKSRGQEIQGEEAGRRTASRIRKKAERALETKSPSGYIEDRGGTAV